MRENDQIPRRRLRDTGREVGRQKPRDSKRIDFINHAQCQAKVVDDGGAGFEGVNAKSNR